MSLQLRLFRPFLRWAVKPHLKRAQTPERARREFARSAKYGFVPFPMALELPETISLENRDLRLLWVSSGAVQPRSVMLYFHGGGYIVGSPKTHAAMIAHLSRLSGVRAVLPRYRLAPDHAFPSQLEDALAAWNLLMSKGYAPQNILIGGDSAGGGLALSLLAHLCQRNQPPAGCFCFSPWTDLTLSGGSLKTNAGSDALLPGERIEELRDHFLQGAAGDDPRASPLFAQFPNCPPVFIQYSTTEILHDDALRMGAALRSQGAAVTLDEWRDLPHVWTLFQGGLPEADSALKRAAKFIRQQLPFPQTDEN